jgi:16S rRNA G1207 methylase RsmC
MSDGFDHYFTGSPATDAERRTMSVALAGREVTVEVAPGVFSPGGVDKGTAVLFAEVPPPPLSGDLLDLGCGWGPIALTLAMESPDATIWAVDVSERALDLVRRNAQRLGLSNVRVSQPDDVPADVTFAAMWSNPPIRIGKEALHLMMRTWLPRLSPSYDNESAGAWMVVQKNLGSDSLARWIEAELGTQHGISVERAASSKGFRILHAQRA